MWKKLQAEYKKFWVKDNLHSFLISLGMIIFAGIIQGVADGYVLRIKGTPVQDFFLDHIPAWDIDGSIIVFSLLFTFLIVLLVLWKPKYLNFIMKSLAVFIVIRAFLISITHLGANPHQLVFDKNNPGFTLYNLLFNTTNDFFFSGHTGIPFLFALIFWREQTWRYVFLVCSAVAGVAMLIAHIHYSIDVFAAPFITYSIYSLCVYFFKHDYQIFRS